MYHMCTDEAQKAETVLSAVRVPNYNYLVSNDIIILVTLLFWTGKLNVHAEYINALPKAQLYNCLLHETENPNIFYFLFV